jgi:hypothetical protein
MRFDDVSPLFKVFYEKIVLRIGFTGADEYEFFAFGESSAGQ